MPMAHHPAQSGVVYPVFGSQCRFLLNGTMRELIQCFAVVFGRVCYIREFDTNSAIDSLVVDVRSLLEPGSRRHSICRK